LFINNVHKIYQLYSIETLHCDQLDKTKKAEDVQQFLFLLAEPTTGEDDDTVDTGETCGTGLCYALALRPVQTLHFNVRRPTLPSVAVRQRTA